MFYSFIQLRLPNIQLGLKVLHLRVCRRNLRRLLGQRVRVVRILVVALGRVLVGVLDHAGRRPRRVPGSVDHRKIRRLARRRRPQRRRRAADRSSERSRRRRRRLRGTRDAPSRLHRSGHRSATRLPHLERRVPVLIDAGGFVESLLLGLV